MNQVGINGLRCVAQEVIIGMAAAVAPDIERLGNHPPLLHRPLHARRFIVERPDEHYGRQVFGLAEIEPMLRVCRREWPPDAARVRGRHGSDATSAWREHTGDCGKGTHVPGRLNRVLPVGAKDGLERVRDALTYDAAKTEAFPLRAESTRMRARRSWKWRPQAAWARFRAPGGPGRRR